MPFKVTPLKEREERLRANIAASAKLKNVPGRASNVGVISAEVAGEVDDVHNHILHQAKQIHAKSADAENLEAKGRAAKLPRNQPVAARLAVKLTGTNGVSLASGSVARHADGREYKTEALATIADGTVAVNVAASKAGVAGNLVIGDKLSLVKTIAGIASIVEVTGIATEGRDLEDLEAYRARVLFRQAHPAGTGHDADYITWAMMVNGVTNVWPKPRGMGLGTVVVRFAAYNSAGNPAPSTALVKAVQDHLDGHVNPVTGTWTGRPGGIEVFAVGVAGNPLNLTFSELFPNDAVTLAAIKKSVQAMLRARAVPGGTIRLDWINEAISQAADEDRHRLSAPTADFTCTVNQVAMLGTVTVPGA